MIWLAEAFTKPAMMHTLAKVGFQQSLHLLRVAQQRSGSSRSTSRELSGEAARLHAPGVLADDARHPHALHAVRRPGRLEAARRAGRHPRADLRHLRRLRADGARGPAGRRGADRQREVRVQGPRTGRTTSPAAARRGSRWPVPHQAQRRSGARTRRCTGCATSRSTTSTTRTSSSSPSAAGSPDGTRRRRRRRRQPRPARDPRDDRAPRHARARAWTRDDTFEAHDLVTDETLDWRRDNYVRLGPEREPVHVIAVRRPGDGASSAGSLHARGSAPNQPGLRHDPEWYRTAVFYEVLVRAFSDSNGSGDRRLPRPRSTGSTTCSGSASTACGCRRSTPSPLRDGGYDISDYTAVLPEFGTLPRVQRADHAGARARHPDHHRLRHEPHQRPAPVVPGVAHRPRRPVRRLLRLVRHRRQVHRRPDHLRRHRDLELDLRPDPPAVLLAPVLQPPARPQLREPPGARGDVRRRPVLDGHRHRRLPARRRALPLRGGGHQLREPPEDARVPRRAAGDGRRRVPRPDPARRGQPAARARSSTTSAPRRRRSARCASTSR